MTHDRVVLVGVDGSEASLHALDWAAEHAVRVGWRLHVLCAYSLPTFAAASLDGGYATLDDATIREGAQAVLDEARARVAGTGVEVSGQLETGDPAGVLVEASKHACLAVVGTRGRSGFAERILGTVSSALPAHAHCPTVVVPFRETQVRATMPVRRIVVGVDGSESAKGALARSIEEAVLWDAELTAVTGMPIGAGSGLLGWLPASVDSESLLADCKAGLDVTVDRALGGRDVRVRRHALDGSGAALLAEFSTAVDLVVVGTRGRGGFAGMLMGSTSQALLHHSACPVMVVPSRTREEDLPPIAPWQL